MSRGLIVGCGYVGGALAARMSGLGHHVTGLRRHPEALPEQTVGLRGDVTVPETLGDLPGNLDWVVYAVSPDDRSPEAYRRAYVTGPANLIDALQARGTPPGRLLFVSSTRVYGERGGDWVDEAVEPKPSDESAKLLLEGEAAAVAAPFPSAVLRLSGIYGPGRDRLLRAVREGSAALPASRPRYTNRIHQDDCAGALAHLLTTPLSHDLYLGTDHEPVDLGDLILWLATQLHAATPKTAANAAASPRAGSADKRCRNDRLVASGYTFIHRSFREGYGAMIRAGTERRSLDGG